MEYVWLIKRDNRFEMTWAICGSLIVHTLLVLLLASTSIYYTAIGNVAKFDILWLSPSSTPMEAAATPDVVSSQPPLTATPWDLAPAKDKLPQGGSEPDSTQPPEPADVANNAELPAVPTPADQADEEHPLDLVTTKPAINKPPSPRKKPPIRPKKTAVIVPKAKPEPEEDDTPEADEPATKPQAAAAEKQQVSEPEMSPPPPAEKIAAAAAEEARLTREKVERERQAAEKIDREQAALLKSRQERLAAEKAEQERIELKQAAAEKAELERLAALKAEQERQAGEEAERQRIAAEGIERERRVAEAARKKAEQERLAKEKAERERLAAEKARERQAAVEKRKKAEREQEARKKAERERLTAERAEQEKLARERERLAKEKAEREHRAVAEKKKRAEQEQQAQKKAEQERLTAERAERDKFARERERLATEKAERERRAAETAQKKAEQERLAKEKAALAERLRLAALQKPLPPVAAPSAPAGAPVKQQPVVRNDTALPSTQPSSRGTAAVKPLQSEQKPAEPSTKETVGPKPSEKPPEAKGFVIPSIHGDLKLIIAGGSDIKLTVLFREYPKSRRNRALTRTEARREQKISPIVVKTSQQTKEAVIETAREGIYIFTVEAEGGQSAEATFTLKVFELSTKGKTKPLGTKTISGKAVVTRILMPDAILWEDESAFSGSMEDSNSTTKFNAETGLTWKEYTD